MTSSSARLDACIVRAEHQETDLGNASRRSVCLRLFAYGAVAIVAIGSYAEAQPKNPPHPIVPKSRDEGSGSELQAGQPPAGRRERDDGRGRDDPPRKGSDRDSEDSEEAPHGCPVIDRKLELLV